MNVHTNCLIPILSSLDKNYLVTIVVKRPLHVFTVYLDYFQNTYPKWKHQIMNVHTKWNCLMPILSIVRLNIAVSGMNNCLPASLETGGGAGNSGAYACMLTRDSLCSPILRAEVT